jgi:hypothetical protein
MVEGDFDHSDAGLFLCAVDGQFVDGAQDV